MNKDIIQTLKYELANMPPFVVPRQCGKTSPVLRPLFTRMGYRHTIRVCEQLETKITLEDARVMIKEYANMKMREYEEWGGIKYE